MMYYKHSIKRQMRKGTELKFYKEIAVSTFLYRSEIGSRKTRMLLTFYEIY